MDEERIQEVRILPALLGGSEEGPNVTTPAGRRKPRRQSRLNPGWFRRGPDPRRSGYQFTASDRRKAWLTTISRYPEKGLWLYIKVKQSEKCKGGGK